MDNIDVKIRYEPFQSYRFLTCITGTFFNCFTRTGNIVSLCFVLGSYSNQMRESKQSRTLAIASYVPKVISVSIKLEFIELN